MTDVVDKATRSRMMAGIRGKNTKPEMIVRKALHARGFRFRLHVKDFPGKPDIVLPRYKTVIFVHGCFWHRHQDCKYCYIPKTNLEVWNKKFSDNIMRDKINIESIQRIGWNVYIIWECELNNESAINSICVKLKENDKNAKSKA